MNGSELSDQMQLANSCRDCLEGRSTEIQRSTREQLRSLQVCQKAAISAYQTLSRSATGQEIALPSGPSMVGDAARSWIREAKHPGHPTIDGHFPADVDSASAGSASHDKQLLHRAEEDSSDDICVWPSLYSTCLYLCAGQAGR